MPKLPMALFSIDTGSQLENAAQTNGIAAVFPKTRWTQLFQRLETVLGNLSPTHHRAKVPFAARFDEVAMLRRLWHAEI
jgi:hypothetical protein